MLCLLFMVWLSAGFKITISCEYGDGCRFPCRCESGVCDSVTGDCPLGCATSPPLNTGLDLGWKGAGCRIGNIAYNKVTTQSGSYEQYTSDLAVDGNTDPVLTNNHCAHPFTGLNGPQAWWMVNFGKKHVIQKIIIFNRGRQQGRTNDFYIWIGMTPTIRDQELCVYYNGGEKSVLTLTCSSGQKAGKYVSMQRREGSYQQYNINICEFVIIGYEPNECNDKCTGVCDDLTGCETCAPGFKLPSCVEECDSGTWGSDCVNLCGKCANNQPCERNTGECNDGCAVWYFNNKCDGYIAKPSLVDSLVEATVLSSSRLEVRWRKLRNVIIGYHEHYFYRVRYGPVGENKILSQDVQHETTTNYLHLELTTLSYNTEYEIEVVPYRVQGEFKEKGVPSNSVLRKTHCIAPSEPYLNVTTEDDAWDVYFTPQRNLNSGCDEMSSYICYAARGSTVIHTMSVWNISSITLPFKQVYDGVDVWVVVNNSENIETKSRKGSLLIENSIVSALPPHGADIDEPPQNNTALITGCVIGVLGGVALAVTLVLIIRKSKRCTAAHRNDEDVQTYETSNSNADGERGTHNYESLDPRTIHVGQHMYQTTA